MLARSLRRLPVTYWFIINEISAVICCEDPSSGIRHSAERKGEKAGEGGEGMVVENVGYQNEQNVTNEEKE